MAKKALEPPLFWQVWTCLGMLGTALAVTGLPSQRSSTPLRTATGARAASQKVAPARMPESAVAPAPSGDRLLARLAVAASAPERCALLERLPPSEETQSTYAITTLLERAQHGSVRACATQALARQPTTEAQSWLIDLAEDPEPEVHRKALDALATRDEPARAVVVEATHHEDLELRISAVEALLKSNCEEGYAAAALVLPKVEDAEMLASLIDALGASHDPRAVPALETLLDQADRESHLHAISALGALGAPSAVTRLAGLLEVGSSEEFSAAVAAMKQLVPEFLARKLQALLASNNAERSELALSELLTLDLPGVTSIMREQLESGETGRMSLVLRRLIQKPEPSLEADLGAMARHKNRRLQALALRALAELSTPSARAALQGFASSSPLAQRLADAHSDNLDEAREKQIAALTRAGAVPMRALIELARDPSPSAQTALLSYLEGHQVDSTVWESVVQVAPSSTVRLIAQRRASAVPNAQQGLIAGLGQRADPEFAQVLRSGLRSDSATRNSAISGLIELGDESAWAEVRRLARAGDTPDRELAVRLLSQRADADAFRELEGLASDTEAQVASSALHALQERSPELVSRLAQRALKNSAPAERANLLLLLSDLNGNLSRPLLELALGDAEDSVAVQAIESLANLQGPASARRLLAVLSDANRSEQVRAEAAASLRALGGPLARANRALIDSHSPPEPSVEFVCSPGY